MSRATGARIARLAINQGPMARQEIGATDMVEIKTHRDHPSSMEERIQQRRRNSGDAKHADYVVQGDKGTITNIHHSRVTSYGPDNRGEPGIDGRMRGPANTKGEI
jgi:hypothetical protein